MRGRSGKIMDEFRGKDATQARNQMEAISVGRRGNF